MWIRTAIILLLIFAQAGFFSNAEAKGDEDYHREILRALKKINSRLVYLETDKMKTIQSIQESLLRQIDEIRNSLQQIQATGEMNKSEMHASIGSMKTKILDVEAHLRNEVMSEFDKQKQESKRFRVQISSLLGQLRNSLATDMENFSKSNEQNFTIFNEGNKEKLQQIVYVLGEQTKQLKQTQALFKTDLIPALDNQSETTRRALLTELTQANIVQKESLQLNQKQVVAALAKMDDDNKKLIAILKQTILVDEEIKNLTVAIQQNIGNTNKNIDQARKMISALSENLAKIDKENQNYIEPKFINLIDASRKISEQSAQIQQSLEESINAIVSNKAQVDLGNEKLTRLIDILKEIAVEQGKIDQVLQGVEKMDVILQAQGKVGQALEGQAQGKIDQVLQEMEKLDLLLKAQEEVDQILQGQGLESVTSQEVISNMQQELKEALTDLRRKANVNISRNDDILKKIKQRK